MINIEWNEAMRQKYCPREGDKMETVEQIVAQEVNHIFAELDNGMKKAASFGIGDWIMQKQNETENHYAYVSEELKNGAFKAIVAGGFAGTKAVSKSTKGWHPTPSKISKSEVPDKLRKAIEKKASSMGVKI